MYGIEETLRVFIFFNKYECIISIYDVKKLWHNYNVILIKNWKIIFCIICIICNICSVYHMNIKYYRLLDVFKKKIF